MTDAEKAELLLRAAEGGAFCEAYEADWADGAASERPRVGEASERPRVVALASAILDEPVERRDLTIAGRFGSTSLRFWGAAASRKERLK